MPGSDSNLVEQLLTQEGWLRRLARALAGDAQAGDDVAQETWARVLAKPPRTVDSPRAWLARVARRVAGEARRDERAREVRERRVARERADSLDGSDNERLEAQTRVQRELTRAVLALSEPARSTIVLRYFEGRSAARIARDTGVPESTVRNRARRALAELRETLDRESGGDRGRWLAALGLAAPRPAPLLAPLPAHSLALYAMTTTTKLFLALSILLFAGVSFLLWESDDEVARPLGLTDVSPEEPALEGSALQEVAVAPERDGGAEPVSEAVDAPAVVPATEPEVEDAPLPDGTVEVVVVRAGAADDGSLDVPVREGRVWIGLSGVFLPRELEEEHVRTRSAPLDVAGTARFTAIAPGPHPVGVSLSGRTPVQARVIVPAGEGSRCVIRLGSAGMRGVVHDPLGPIVAGARIQLSRRTAPVVHLVLTTDADGVYDARDLPAGPYGVGVDLDGVQDPHGADYSALVDLEAGAVLEHDFGDPLGLPLWSGVVRTAAGEAAQRNRTSFWPGRIHLERADGTYSYHLLEDDGSFAIRTEPGTYRVSLSPPGRNERTVVLEELRIDGDTTRNLALPGTTLAGFAAEGQWVSLRRGRESRPTASVERAEDGRYRFDGVVPGTWWVTAGESALEVEVRAEDVALQVDLR